MGPILVPPLFITLRKIMTLPAIDDKILATQKDLILRSWEMFRAHLKEETKRLGAAGAGLVTTVPVSIFNKSDIEEYFRIHGEHDSDWFGIYACTCGTEFLLNEDCGCDGPSVNCFADGMIIDYRIVPGTGRWGVSYGPSDSPDMRWPDDVEARVLITGERSPVWIPTDRLVSRGAWEEIRLRYTPLPVQLKLPF